MLLALWYSLRGYVKIKVVGFSAERFMNLAAFRGVFFWEVSRTGAGITMKAGADSLSVLEGCAEKTGCSMELLSQGGLPVLLGRFRRRQIFAAGLLFFAAGLYLLSSFLWTVEVEGNERLQTAEILSACREMGLRPGAWKRNVDTAAVTDELLLSFSDISWVSVGIEGTNAVIRLAETIEKAELVDRETPCDIVAAQDGVIVQLTAEQGTPQVQAGDVVQKGDVLISAALTIGLEGEAQHTEYTAAEGAVTARIWQSLSEELPLAYEEKQYTGAEKENHILLFADKELDVLRPTAGDTLWERTVCSEGQLALGDFRLPLGWKKELWQGYALLQKNRTTAEAKTLLEEKLRKKAENLVSSCGKIENISITFTEYADSVRAEAKVTLLDRIEEKRQIVPEERERENPDEF